MLLAQTTHIDDSHTAIEICHEIATATAATAFITSAKDECVKYIDQKRGYHQNPCTRKHAAGTQSAGVLLFDGIAIVDWLQERVRSIHASNEA